MADQIRSELGLRMQDPFEPNALAALYGIEVATTTQVAENAGLDIPDDVHCEIDLPGVLPLTVVWGERRLVLLGGSRSRTQTRYDLTHELSHAVLEHPYSLDSPEGGIATWTARQEAEADWLACAMLVPVGALAPGKPPMELADAYGVDDRVVRLRTVQP